MTSNYVPGLNHVPETLLVDEAIATTADKEYREIAAAHLGRYWWAWVVAQERHATRIVDLGCGAGYGCQILARESAAHVIGMDNDWTLQGLARKAVQDEARIEIINTDLNGKWVSTPRYDLAACFHVLEELRHRDIFLEQLTAALDEDGMALFSVPYASRLTDLITSPGKGGPAIGLPGLDVCALLRRFFRNVQWGRIGYPLTPRDNENFPGLEFCREVEAMCPDLNLLGQLFVCTDPIKPS